MAHPERKAQRALQRLAGATSCAVEVVADHAALLAAIDDSTIVVIDAALARARPELRSHPARAWIAVPGEGLAPGEPSHVNELLAAGWGHVIAHPMPLLAEELLATAQKLIRGDVFGLEKYMAWGAEIRSYVLDDTHDRDDAVATVTRDIAAVGLPERIGSLVSVIADELIANAMYAAPIDEAGSRFRAGEPRDKSRALAGRETVSLRWGTDGRYLALEVRDTWGTIDPHAIGRRLATTRTSTAVSGMGLPLVYACTNQLAIACAPGKVTEVIAMLDVRHKPTELARCASFHVFAGTAPP